MNPNEVAVVIRRVDRARAYLESIAKMVSDSKLPGGCFVTTSACEAGSDCLPKHAVQAVLKINKATTSAFINYLKDEQAKGKLASTTSPEALADFLLTIQFGLAVMSRNGIKRDRLVKVISQATSNF